MRHEHRHSGGRSDQVKRVWASRDMCRNEALRQGAFVEDALNEKDAIAAQDVEQGIAERIEPAFLDAEGPSADSPTRITLPKVIAHQIIPVWT